MKKNQEIKLEHQTNKDIHLSMNAEERPKEKAEIAASMKAQLRLPREENDRTFLLACKMEAECKAAPKFFSAKVSSDFYFSSIEKIEEYDAIVREVCMPEIQERCMELIKTLLSDMGYSDFIKGA